MFLHPILWAVLLVVFLLVEASTVSLVSLWFAAGALAAMAVSFLGGGFAIQTAVFLVVSGVCLALLRPLVRKFIRPKLTPTNADALIGTQGLVTSQIDNLAATGQVKLRGMEWSARSTDGWPIEPGTRIRVDRIEGVKVFVTAVKETVKS